MKQSNLTWTNERRKLSDLTPWERNPRQIKDKQAKRLAESFETFGQVETIAISEDGDIYNGHQRLSVLAGQHGMDYEVDVRVSSRPLEEREREKLTVFLHRGATGEWNFDELANWDMSDLLEWGFEESDFPFDVAGAMGKGGDTAAETDRAEELQAKWQTADGQIWKIGKHFVICADCREPQTWQQLLQAANVKKVNGVFTSPPYAMQRKDQYGGVETDKYVEWWELVQAQVKENLAQDGSFFVNIKAHCEEGQRVLYCMDLVCAMVRKWGWLFVDELIWVNPGVPGRWPNRFKEGFESIYDFCIDSKIKFHPDNVATPTDRAFSGDGRTHIGKKGGWIVDNGTYEGMALPSNAIKVNVGNEAGAGTHAAAFPVALPDFFIRAYSDPGDVWIDPFCGSGTTMVAAHNNKRIGIGIEKLPKYLAVILERMQTHTGIAPTLIT